MPDRIRGRAATSLIGAQCRTFSTVSMAAGHGLVGRSNVVTAWRALAMAHVGERLLGCLVLAMVTCSCEGPVTARVFAPEPASPTVEYVWRQEILTPLPVRVRLPSHYGA